MRRGPYDRVLVPRDRVAVAVVCLLMLMAASIGEPDRAEVRAIGTVHALIYAELDYASQHEGSYGELGCVANPSCNPRVQDIPFDLDRALAVRPEANGYRFAVHSGPAGAPGAVSPPPRGPFAVVAVPLDSETVRRRAFCGDERGIFFTRGREPRVENGRCLETSRYVPFSESRWGRWTRWLR